MDHLKGDIVRANRRRRHEGYHYIVVWNDFVEGRDFIGVMLTRASQYPDNIPMSIDHFVQGTELVHNKSQHFVNRLFIKFAAWGPFTKVGELTEAGARFVEDNLQDIEPVTCERILD